MYTSLFFIIFPCLFWITYMMFLYAAKLWLGFPEIKKDLLFVMVQQFVGGHYPTHSIIIIFVQHGLSKYDHDILNSYLHVVSVTYYSWFIQSSDQFLHKKEWIICSLVTVVDIELCSFHINWRQCKAFLSPIHTFVFILSDYKKT